MDDNAPKENPPAGFNKLDLSQLQGFSFGTQWTQDKSASPSHRETDDRPRRDDRRDGAGPGGPDRRDRRAFRKPVGPASNDAPPAGAPAPASRDNPDRPARRDGPGGDYRGAPRREGTGGYDRNRRHEAPVDRGPYDSPYFSATFYPEDTSFNTLVQTIRKSCRTIELFEIARTVVGKLDRFIVVLTRKTPPVAPGTEPPPRKPLAISVPDSLPFDTEEAAIAHVMSTHLGQFFVTSEAEIDPPKGNFQVVNRCTITGELLGPPNYHRYAQIVQQHHAAKVPRMSLEAYRSRIESVRDPELIAQWLEKMKKTTRYTWKLSPSSAPVAPAQAASAPAPVASSESAAPGGTAPAAEPAAVPAEAAAPAPTTEPAPAAPEAPPAIAFDSLEEARNYLLAHARDRVVRLADSVRFPGKICESLPEGEIRDAVEGALERQRRFPLDTANALRGRLRREHFTIFKKGSKGVSYVCAVKRKFRVPGQTFADTIGALISYIENNPMVRASELPAKFLGLKLPPQEKNVAASVTGTTPPLPAAPPAEHALSIDERAKLARMQGDLVWLVREGYVTEFIDGRLFAPPPMVEARKKEVEAEDNDPENFPEAPATETSMPNASAADVPAPTPPPAEMRDAAPASPEPAADSPPLVPTPVDETPSAVTEGPVA